MAVAPQHIELETAPPHPRCARSHGPVHSQNRRFGVSRVLSEWRIPRSTFYERRRRAARPAPEAPKRRGPKTACTDACLTEHIRQVIKDSAFGGEGYRKVWARLRCAGIRAGKPRILRLMREANLLAPQRAGNPRGPKAHDGTITTEAPDVMWGTDATATHTVQDGQVTVFVAVDHCASEAIGLHAAKRADRFEALEPILQGVRRHFDGPAPQAAHGLSVRHDHGSQYMSRHFQRELAFLGIEASPAFVRESEGNGVAERFIRTLKEQLLWVRDFDTVEDLNRALQEWLPIDNEQWLVHRHGHRSPAQVRRDLTPLASTA